MPVLSCSQARDIFVACSAMRAMSIPSFFVFIYPPTFFTSFDQIEHYGLFTLPRLIYHWRCHAFFSLRRVEDRPDAFSLSHRARDMFMRAREVKTPAPWSSLPDARSADALPAVMSAWRRMTPARTMMRSDVAAIRRGKMMNHHV